MSELLNAAIPVVFPDGTMAPAFRDFIRRLSDNLPIIGTGTPEGVLAAPQFSLFIDDAGITGTIEYRKMLTDIGGDTTKGWVLV